MTRLLLSMFSAFMFALGSFSTASADETFGPLDGFVFGDGDQALVIFLHGDISGGGPANYHYRIVTSAGGGEPDAVIVGLLRPGYDDGAGRQSPGTNHERRDQYTAENNALVAETIASLIELYQPERTIVVGHSGGAAQLGVVIGRYPGLVDTAILLSCPCDLIRWRDARNARRFVRSESPIDFVDAIDPSTRIVAMTGVDDENTFPFLAEEYVAAAQANGLEAELILVEGATHWNGKLLYEITKLIKAEIHR